MATPHETHPTSPSPLTDPFAEDLAEDLAEDHGDEHDFHVPDADDEDAPALPHKYEEWMAYIEDGRPQGSPLEDHLARSYAPLVLRTLDRVRNRYANADEHELASNAFFGLLHAIRTYDPDKGKFDTWGINTMMNRIADGQRGSDWISRNRRSNVKKVAAAIEALAQRGFHFPTDTEIAKEAHIEIDAVGMARSDASRSKVGSIDSLAESGDNSMDSARPVSHDAHVESLFNAWGLDYEGLSAHFWDAVKMLPDRPKQVLAMFVWGGLRQEEIAEVYSVSHSRVSQIFADTAKRLRANMEALAANA